MISVKYISDVHGTFQPKPNHNNPLQLKKNINFDVNTFLGASRV